MEFEERRRQMSEVKYPHRATVSMTDKLYQEFMRQAVILLKMDGLPTAVHTVVLGVLASVEEGSQFPVFLMEEE